VTKRQKLRLMRASSKGNPLAYIRLRAMQNGISLAIAESMEAVFAGHKTMAVAMRNAFRKSLAEIVLRPIIRSVTQEIRECFQ